MGNKVRSLDIAEISQKSGIGSRRLRYVLDHEIVSLIGKSGRGRGARRKFPEYYAFAIACAALLLESGLRQNVARGIMDILIKSRVGQIMGYIDAPLLNALNCNQGAILEVADGVNIRLKLESTHDLIVMPVKDTGWLQVATGANLAKHYEPLITVRFDIKRLRDRLDIHP
jgi:hypothetical protein